MEIKEKIYKSIDNGDLILFKELYPLFKEKYCAENITIDKSDKLGEIDTFVMWIQLILPITNLINHSTKKIEVDIKNFIINQEEVDYDEFSCMNYHKLFDKDIQSFNDFTDHMIYMNKHQECYNILEFLLINNFIGFFIEKMKLINIYFKDFKIESFSLINAIVPFEKKDVQKVFYLIDKHIEDRYVHNLLVDQLYNSNELNLVSFANIIIDLKGDSFTNSDKLVKAMIDRNEYEETYSVLYNYFSKCSTNFILESLSRYSINNEMKSMLLSKML